MNKTLKALGLALAFASAMCMLALCLGCSSSGGYQEMPMKDAEQWMEQNKGTFVLVDVRTPEEYATGHIPGAILVPIEQIKGGNYDGLPAKDETILLYCRTGRRAADAAELLVKEGYNRIYVIGGIFDWSGEVEK